MFAQSTIEFNFHSVENSFAKTQGVKSLNGKYRTKTKKKQIGSFRKHFGQLTLLSFLNEPLIMQFS